MDQDLNRKIKDAMQSLDGIRKASPSPFFFARVEGRMLRQKSRWETVSSFLSKPLVAVACICLVILINAAVIFSSAQINGSAERSNSELAAADEYNSVSAPLYEFVNATP